MKYTKIDKKYFGVKILLIDRPEIRWNFKNILRIGIPNKLQMMFKTGALK